MKNLICLISGLLLFILAPSLSGQTATDKIIEGIYQEEVKGDLTKAFEIYNDILENCGNDRPICAQALYHLGLISEKTSGNMDVGTGLVPVRLTAENYYVRLIENYPEVGEYANLARIRIDKIKNANTFIDPRDGHKYKYVQISDQTWMAENLAFMPWVNPPKKQEFGIWVYDYEGEDVTEAMATENYQKYGCLYDWPTAMALSPLYLEKDWNGNSENHQGLCPPGWRIPSDKDWMEMESTLGMPDSVLERTWDRAGESIGLPPLGRYLRSSHSWHSGRGGDNSSGLNCLPGGIIFPDGTPEFQSIGYQADFWTSTPSDYKTEFYPNKPFSWYRYLFPKPTSKFADANELGRDMNLRGQGSSVRCIKNKANVDQEQTSSELFVIEGKKRKPIQRVYDFTNSQLLDAKWYFETRRINYPATVKSESIVFSCVDSTMYRVNKHNGEVNWKTNLGGIELSERKLRNDTIFGTVGSSRTRQNYIYELNINTGEILQKTHSATGERIHRINIDKNNIFAEGNDLICFDISSLSEVWRYKTDTLNNNEDRFKPSIRGIAVYEDVIVIGIFHTKIGNRDEAIPLLIGIDRKSKKAKWIVNGYGLIQQILISRNGMSIFGSGDGHLYAINQETGKNIWKTYIGKEFGNKIFSTDSIAVVKARGGKWAGINIKDGRIIWTVEGISLSPPTPVQYEDNVIAIDHKQKIVYCMNLESGELVWNFKIPSKPSSIATDQKHVYVTAEDGLYCYDISELI